MCERQNAISFPQMMDMAPRSNTYPGTGFIATRWLDHDSSESKKYAIMSEPGCVSSRLVEKGNGNDGKKDERARE